MALCDLSQRDALLKLDRRLAVPAVFCDDVVRLTSSESSRRSQSIMTTAIQKIVQPPIEYPDDNGEPMAENTLQFTWIVVIKEGLEALFRHNPDVFVAGDLLWYPVEGKPKIRSAPDAMVAFGRPKGRRGSYKQWEEAGVAPQVVFEVLSPGNRPGEMAGKFEFYETYGVEEYYIYDPDDGTLIGLAAGEQPSGTGSRHGRIRKSPARHTIRARRRDGQSHDHRPRRQAVPDILGTGRKTRDRRTAPTCNSNKSKPNANSNRPNANSRKPNANSRKPSVNVPIATPRNCES